MKTSLDIPDQALRELRRNTKAKTMREAILRAISEYNHRHRLSQLAQSLGTYDRFSDQKELRIMREDKQWKGTR